MEEYGEEVGGGGGTWGTNDGLEGKMRRRRSGEEVRAGGRWRRSEEEIGGGGKNFTFLKKIVSPKSFCMVVWR